MATWVFVPTLLNACGPSPKKFPKLNTRRATEILFADDSDLAAYLAARRRVRMYVHIGGTRPHGGTSVELLAWMGAGYDVCGSDSPSHAPLLRALRGKPARR